MVTKKPSRSRAHLRIVDGSQGTLFPAAGEIRTNIPFSLDELLIDKKEDGSKALTVLLAPDYGINEKTLAPFFAKVSYDEKGQIEISFFDHFLASKYLYHGIYALEQHVNGDLVGGKGVPQEVLAVLRPSERVSVYLMSYIAKYKDKDIYRWLLKLPFDEKIIQLAKEGFNRYHAIKRIKVKEDKRGSFQPLKARLFGVEIDKKEKFDEAFRAIQPPVRDIYRAGPLTSENPEVFYYHGIDTHVLKIIEAFKDLYRVKAAKP